MDVSELLLAAEVRKLALQIRRSRWAAFAAAANIGEEGGKHPQQYERIKTRWELNHPVSTYIPDASAQLKNVALQLRGILTDD